ncbi:MAG: hypothetical protein RLQ12_23620 [Cyclobacteriaceae bacterium]
MRLTDYTYTLRHDHGKIKIKIRDSSEAQARKKLLEDQLCPERAIINIKSKTV